MSSSSSFFLPSTAQSRDFLERIIPEVKTGGARNIVELAKTLKMPVETTRYKMKGLSKKGLSLRAFVDYTKLGLSYYYVNFYLTQKSREVERKFLQVLGESCFMTSCARQITTANGFACTFALPQVGKTSSSSSLIHRFLRGLVEEKLIDSSPTVTGVTNRREHMLQPEFFNLKRAKWEIDWARLLKRESPPMQARAEERKEATTTTSVGMLLDETDLVIARLLEIDALTKLSDIAESLKTTLNNVFYHFHKHIMEEKLIEEFLIRWNAPPGQEAMFVQFEFFESLSSSEERSARSALRKLPFLWSDAFSKDTGFYIGEAMVPSSQFVGMLGFLSSSLGELARKLRVVILDAKTRQQYPLPSHLFGQSGWVFDPDLAVEHLNSKIKK